MSPQQLRYALTIPTPHALAFPNPTSASPTHRYPKSAHRLCRRCSASRLLANAVAPVQECHLCPTRRLARGIRGRVDFLMSSRRSPRQPNLRSDPKQPFGRARHRADTSDNKRKGKSANDDGLQRAGTDRSSKVELDGLPVDRSSAAASEDRMESARSAHITVFDRLHHGWCNLSDGRNGRLGRLGASSMDLDMDARPLWHQREHSLARIWCLLRRLLPCDRLCPLLHRLQMHSGSLHIYLRPPLRPTHRSPLTVIDAALLAILRSPS
jgi:hypothetical protein